MTISARTKWILGMLVLLGVYAANGKLYAQKISGDTGPLVVMKCNDFDVTGDGRDPEWKKTGWHPLTRLDSAGVPYATRFKILYSAKGIYVLFDGQDNRISTNYDQDFQDLFKADVFEVFFHPDTTLPMYLEYEVNALDKELVLLIPNLNGRVSGWIPWHYEKGRQVKKMVHVTGGKPAMNGIINSWSAELFFPYSLFSPLGNVPPVSGMIWHANFYRLDYDSGTMVKWSWAPIEHSFHEFRKFGSMVFE
ncbi:MAG: carbohydrate-binding family 9-like protein [Chitinophagales bacterium]